ncbi:MAG: ABC transporter ATP-binding protein [Proteobacteria bacterium]|nr:ABC transporter ATP-binding protein [Pseudomonadota bacterium]
MQQNVMPKRLPKKLIPFIWHFLKNYKLLFSLNVMAITMWVVGTTLSAFYAKELIDALPLTRGLEFKEAFIFCIPFILALVITEILTFGHGLVKFIRAQLFPSLNADIKADCYEYISYHSSKYFSENFAGSIAGKINNLGSQIEQMIKLLVGKLYQELLSFIIMMIVMYFVSPLFTFMFIVWFMLTFAMLVKIGKRCEYNSENLTKTHLRSDGELIDNIENNSILKAFNKEIQSLNFFVGFLKKEKQADEKLRLSTAFLDFILRIAVFIISNSIRIGFVIGFIKGWLTIGEITLLIVYRSKLNRIVWALTDTLTPFFTTMGKIKESIKIITKAHDIIDAKDAKPLALKDGAIEFKKISFSYDDEDEAGNLFTTDVFKNLDLNISSKEKVGIVGLSGAGKSSLASLILRLYEAQKGSIKIDKQDTKNVLMGSLRGVITLIPQDTSLFHRSLLENIKLGDENASKEDVEKAAQLAYAHDFILKSPKGYNTVVGERGVKLSGGQRQRIAIARAFLKDSPILILDEATSALDSESESYIQKSLAELMKDKTTIVIAHRLSTLKQMDRILVLDNGKIVEQGTHGELSKQNGIYAKMWDRQTNHE